MNPVEEGKWLLGVISFECTNSVFNLTVENNSFSILAPDHWNSEDGEEPINKLIELLELRSENDIKLHVKEVRRRGSSIEVENSGYNLAGFDHFKSEIVQGFKKVKYKDLDDMVFKMQLTYNEIVDILDVKYLAGSTKPIYKTTRNIWNHWYNINVEGFTPRWSESKK